MGTSKSKPDAPPGRGLIPPWADGDPPLPPPEQPPPEPPPPAVPEVVALPRRFRAFRTALGMFAAAGGSDTARRALGHWARTSIGGAAAARSRVARAAQAGGAGLAAFAGAGERAPASPGALDVRSLSGLPAQVAIDRIVDWFCPAGILDEDLARIAMGEALVEALTGADTFDPNAIDDRAVDLATLRFAAELVFLQLAGDAGEALARAPSPAAAVLRERELRALVREVADVVGTPILTATARSLTPDAMSSLVSRIVSAVVAEMELWE
jgi:hypothetical protein